jgi:hypothetical protein
MIDTTKLNINSGTKVAGLDQFQPQNQGNYDWSMPDWMGRGTYDWWGRNPDPGFGTPEQPWYRHPSWGLDAVYNPYYGYQNVKDIADLYSSGQDFWQWGLPQQTGQDWSQYGFTQGNINKDQLADRNNGMSTENIGEMIRGLLNPDYSDLPYYPGADVGAGQGFQYPEQWDWASNVMGNFASGDPTQVPWQWNQASDFGQQMMQGGMPVDVSGYKEAMAPVLERQFGDMARQQFEDFGMGGLRWSTPAQGAIAREGSRLMENYGLGLADRDLAAQEAARQRQMGAGSLMQGLGAGVAGLGESARDRALRAAGGLSGLGQQYLNAPQDWAQQMWGMGSQQQNTMQQALDRAYQDFMRMAPEYSPWLQQLMGYVGLQPQVAPQQYGQSGLGSLFGGLLGMLPFLGR